MFMEDVGSMENTTGKQRYSPLSWLESSVESIGHCQPAGNWIAIVYNHQALAGSYKGNVDSHSFCRKNILQPRSKPFNSLDYSRLSAGAHLPSFLSRLPVSNNS
jgi:hypothetical protein